jgi:hypothetical protein
MLYDKKWDAKPDLEYQGITLSGFIAWLEQQPADKEYNYFRSDLCAAAQYLQSQGRRGQDCIIQLPLNWLNEIVMFKPWTFGAALDRAREVAARA